MGFYKTAKQKNMIQTKGYATHRLEIDLAPWNFERWQPGCCPAGAFTAYPYNIRTLP